ncbi:hypothetical protein D9M71_306490 [compost metagenome]
MEQRTDHAEHAAGVAFDEIALVQVVADLAVREVAEFVAFGQVVHRDDVGFATLVERLDQVAADEAGGASDDDAHVGHSVRRMGCRQIIRTRAYSL